MAGGSSEGRKNRVCMCLMWLTGAELEHCTPGLQQKVAKEAKVVTKGIRGAINRGDVS